MRTSTIVLAGALAAVASAQGSLPPACANFLAKTTECIPDTASDEDIVSPEIVSCVCEDAAGFSRDVVDCLDAVSEITSFPADALAVLQGFEQYCQLLGGGGGGSSPGSSGSNTIPSATETETEPSETSATSRGSGGGSTPTPTAIDTGSENCDYLLGGLRSCWTDGSALPTAAPVADCLCSASSFDAAVEGCYSDIINVSPQEASTISAFAGFCSSYSDGAFGGSARPTATDDDSTSATDAPDPTSMDDDDTPSSTARVIQTLAPTTTSGSNNDGGNNGGTGPNSAAGLKVTILGTAFAAIIAGAALIL